MMSFYLSIYQSIFSMDSGFVEEGPLQQLLLWSFTKILDPYEYDCIYFLFIIFDWSLILSSF